MSSFKQLTEQSKSFQKTVSNYFLRSNKRKTPSITSDDSSSAEDNKTDIFINTLMDSATESKLTMQYRDIVALINPYNGSRENYQAFIYDCERALEEAGNDIILYRRILKYIISKVSALGCSFINTHSLSDWEEIKEICDHKFSEEKTEADVLHRITSFRQGNLNVFDFYSKFSEFIMDYSVVIQKEHHKESDSYRLSMERINQISMKSFMNGLNDDIRKSILYQNPENLREAYKLARKYEDNERNRPNSDTQLAKTLKDLLKLAEDPGNSQSFTNPQVKRTEGVECQLCGGGHTAKQCNNNPNNIVCQLCNQNGHSATNCQKGINGGFSNNRRGGNFSNYNRQLNNNNGYQQNRPHNNNYNSNYRGRGGYNNGPSFQGNRGQGGQGNNFNGQVNNNSQDFRNDNRYGGYNNNGLR